jgi:DNA-binding CsgD family transcriptional regulator
LQVVLNKRDKEQLVIKLYEEGKTIREIAHQAHLSFRTIGKIIRRINGPNGDETAPKDMNNKSKETQALSLFLQGKRPIDVAIELDLSSDEVEYYQQEYWILNGMDDLALAYLEIRNHLDLFLSIFHLMKKNKIINHKDIQTILKYCIDLPSLENKFRSLANTVLDLEIKKKELSTQLVDLGHAINQYQHTIDTRKELLHINKRPVGRNI